MIRGIHGMFITPEAEALRAFLRDVLEIPARDVGRGFLIYNSGESELGVHETGEGAPETAGMHMISFYTDDVHAEVARLRAKGANFEGEVVDQGWGLAITLLMPGGVKATLYQKRY
jgi:catechol 2,3-dioxygenase-like lactoylglutathione lyase family enzyme